MAELVGDERLLACLVEWGGTNLGPGRLGRSGPALHAPSHDGSTAFSAAEAALLRSWRRRPPYPD